MATVLDGDATLTDKLRTFFQKDCDLLLKNKVCWGHFFKKNKD